MPPPATKPRLATVPPVIKTEPAPASPFARLLPDVMPPLERVPPEEGVVSQPLGLERFRHVVPSVGGRVREEELAPLNREQQDVWDAVKEGLSVAVTGVGGSGKTHLLKYMIARLDAKTTFVTAPTGIAAVPLGGTTLHSWAGIGIDDLPVHELVWRATRNEKNWKDCRVLIIDEKSMMSGPLFDTLEEIARRIRRDDRPFGGIQLVLSGDFLQLPPVAKNGRVAFAFETESWRQCINRMFVLREVFRQSDLEFVKALNQIRMGNLGDHAKAVLEPCKNRVLDTSDGIEPTMLYSTKKDTNAENLRRLELIREAPRTYKALYYTFGGTEINGLKKGIAVDTLTLKVGAQVMLVKNMSQTLVNGSRGVVVGWYDPNLLTEDEVEEEDPTPENNQPVSVREEPSYDTCPPAKRPCLDTETADGAKGGGKDASGPSAARTDTKYTEPVNGEEYRVANGGGEYRSHYAIPTPPVGTPHPLWPIVQFMNGIKIAMRPKKWEVNKYGNVVATMIQVPLILAYALTVHKCVSRDTMVSTSMGLIPIHKLAAAGQSPNSWGPPNDPIQVHTPTGLKDISQVYKGTVEPALRIQTARGYSIVCSFQHPLRVCASDGTLQWVKSPDLKVGDVLCMQVDSQSGRQSEVSTKRFEAWFQSTASTRAYRPARIPDTIGSDLCYLFGVLIGDGCLTNVRDGRVEWVGVDLDIMEACEDIVRRYNDCIISKDVKKGTGVQRTMFHSIHFREFMHWCGIPYARAEGKSIPWVVRQNTVECQTAFLQGLFDSDGGINRNVHYTTVSESLADGIQILLANQGIVCCKSILHEAGTIGNCLRAYRITISGCYARMFQAKIGFRCERKRVDLDRKYGEGQPHLSVKCQVGEIPHGRQLMIDTVKDLIANSGSKRKRLPKFAAGVNSYVSRIRNGAALMRCAHLPFITESFPQLSSTAGGRELIRMQQTGVYFEPITSITPSLAEMYDLTVPDGHTFVGNLFVNHNCQGMTLDKVTVSTYGIFENGQLYVALSRARSLAGLSITGPVTAKEAKADAVALQFYRDLDVDLEYEE
jgi:hypothetical protein